MGERRTAFRERPEQRIAVSDRLVTRHGQAAAQTAGRRNRGGGRRHVCRILRDLGKNPLRLDITDEMVLIECRVAHT